jgi:hypothetical protein
MNKLFPDVPPANGRGRVGRLLARGYYWAYRVAYGARAVWARYTMVGRLYWVLWVGAIGYAIYVYDWALLCVVALLCTPNPPWHAYPKH